MNKTKKYSIIGIGIFIGLVIIGNLLPPVPEDEEAGNRKVETIDSSISLDSTNLKTITLGDKELCKIYKSTYDSLYNLLLAQDNPDCIDNRRVSLHKEIKSFIYDDWWNMMEIVDSARTKLPICRKEYEAACKQYDKQYERFLKYGDEDIDRIEYWAKENASRYLQKVAVDPETVVIEDVKSTGKGSKGWKCKVIYRAKNGFGGYVRESLSLIMSYDADNNLYQCIDIQ